MPLRLVPGDSEAPGDLKKKRFKPYSTLTDAQQVRLRVAVKNLRHAYGSLKAAAEITGLPVHVLYMINNSRRCTLSVAARLAMALHVPIELLLEGGVLSADRCPHCGQTLDVIGFRCAKLA
ncbi:MAG: helix-turn-helix transcriptional regulator [Polyangiaceae bacterium]|jgi:hypothetical protein